LLGGRKGRLKLKLMLKQKLLLSTQFLLIMLVPLLYFLPSSSNGQASLLQVWTQHVLVADTLWSLGGKKGRLKLSQMLKLRLPLMLNLSLKQLLHLSMLWL